MNVRFLLLFPPKVKPSRVSWFLLLFPPKKMNVRFESAIGCSKALDLVILYIISCKSYSSWKSWSYSNCRCLCHYWSYMGKKIKWLIHRWARNCTRKLEAKTRRSSFTTTPSTLFSRERPMTWYSKFSTISWFGSTNIAKKNKKEGKLASFRYLFEVFITLQGKKKNYHCQEQNK